MGALISNRLVAVLIAFIFSWQLYQAILHFREPYTYTSAHAEPPLIHDGDPLSVVYEFDRIRYCRTELVRFVVRRFDQSVLWRDSAPGGATRLGHHIVMNDIKLPSLPAGLYTLRTMVFSDCSDSPHASVGPDVDFEVLG